MGLRKNPNNMNQKIFIKTFGCQMNEYDSNRILDTVKKIGYEKTEKYEDANCYLLNTCHIRDKAKEKVYSEIGRVKKIFRFKKSKFKGKRFGSLPVAIRILLVMNLSPESKVDSRFSFTLLIAFN